MKKIYLLALLCLPVALKAQNGVVFKIKYEPNHAYNMNVGFGIKMNANVTGDPNILQKLKDEGITQPLIALLGLGVNANIKTGAAGSDNTFPMTMDVKIDSVNVSANGKQAPIPPTVTDKTYHLAGHIGSDNAMKIDSVNGKVTNDSTQKKMQQMTNMMHRHIQFPTTPMKPGDSFTQTTPINVPMKGGNIKVDASVTYTLLSISGDNAYFDVTPKFSMSFSMKGISANIGGTGASKMVYSIKNNFPVSNNGTFNMTLKVTSPQVNVDATAVVTSGSKTVIN